MKNCSPFLLLLCFIIYNSSPVNAQCDIPTAQATLNGNQISAQLPHGGDFFWDGNNAGYGLGPTSSSFPNVKTIFAGGLWIGGYEGINLKLAATEYGLSDGRTDYVAGPLTQVGTTSADICNDWDRHWEATSSDISLFRADWADGTFDDPIPVSVLGWPGRGNENFATLFGFDLPMQNLAPFHDFNFNGIYEPQEGDYPDIKKADHAIYWIFNDAGSWPHEESGGNALRVEVHVLAYAYDDANEVINKTTFYDLQIINKNVADIHETFIGLWIDPALGCNTDDYIGCDPENQMAYIYNADAEDGDLGCQCPAGIETFCDEIPMVGVKMLEGVNAGRVFGPNGELEVPDLNQTADTLIRLGLSKFSYYNNGAETPPPTPGTDDPTSPLEYYNLLSGKFTDGTPITTGGDGYNPGGASVDYAFSDSPDEVGGWSMCGSNLEMRDRKMILSTGPFTFESGEINTMSFAIIHVPNVPHPCPSLEPLINASQVVEDFLYNGFVSTETPLSSKLYKITAVPNPFTTQTELQFPDLADKVKSVELFNVTGQQVRTYENVTGKSLVIKKSGLQAGIYFYKIRTNSQQYISGRLIVH